MLQLWCFVGSINFDISYPRIYAERVTTYNEVTFEDTGQGLFMKNSEFGHVDRMKEEFHFGRVEESSVEGRRVEAGLFFRMFGKKTCDVTSEQ